MTTIGAFWRMIWETESRAIVMVTGLTEAGKEKCARYWPRSKTEVVAYDGYNVRVVSGKRQEGYKKAVLSLTSPSGEAREIHHFWFDSWPDYGVPEEPLVVAKMLKAVRLVSHSPGQPWTVHCSAGIGRTGAFIGIDIGINMLERARYVAPPQPHQV